MVIRVKSKQSNNKRVMHLSMLRMGIWFFGLLCLALIFIRINWPVVTIRPVFDPKNAPELAVLAPKDKNFPELSKYFQQIARKKGAQYAFEVLQVAPMPTNIDMHLMGHIVGDELFKQQGVKGMQYCTNDFRNACSHSIVVGLYLRDGVKSLPIIADACRSAPGGSGAYMMCFHGLGHGVLAAVGYELPKAVELCQKTNSPAGNFGEASECIGGAVMETISGGFHNPELWKKQTPQYFRAEDPLYPCDSDLIPDIAKDACYMYLTPHLFTAAGGDLGAPKEADFVGAFSYCDQLSYADFRSRNACFGGLGKEFITIVQGRDIRKIDQLTVSQLAQVRDWCGLTKNPAGNQACLFSAANSMFWGGENDYHVVLRFCSLMIDAQKQSCYQNLIGGYKFYVTDNKKRIDFCKNLPEAYQDDCRTELGI